MAIYHDDADRCRFLATLESSIERYRLECHAYCLMPNHYHLVLRTLEPNLSTAIQYLNGVYAQWWNRRHARVGHMLQGRFKAQLIQRDGYFLEACRYVVLNPVRAGIVKHVENFAWSSYRSTAGLEPQPRWLTTELVLGTHAAAAWHRAYAVFIAAGLSENDVARAIRSDIPIVGGTAFAAKYMDVSERAHPTEVVLRERTIGRPTLAELFADVPNTATRNRRIREARDRFHYRVSEIAQQVSLHYASVSRIASSGRPPNRSAKSDMHAPLRQRRG